MDKWINVIFCHFLQHFVLVYEKSVNSIKLRSGQYVLKFLEILPLFILNFYSKQFCSKSEVSIIFKNRVFYKA